MSKLPGTRVKALKIQIDGRVYKVEVRMREHGMVAQFAAFCREPKAETGWLESPAEAQVQVTRAIKDQSATEAEPWLLVTIGGLSGGQPVEDPNHGRLEVQFQKVYRADVGTPTERHRIGDGYYASWRRGAPETSDDLQHRRTDEFPPPQVDTRTFLVRETPEVHLHLSRLIAKLEEVWYAWLALTEGPDIDLEELIDRGQLTAHARPECRWDVTTGNYPEEV